MCVACPSKTITWWKCTISIKTKTSSCLPTSTFSWALSPPLGHVVVSIKPSNSWVNADSVIYLEEPGQPNPPLGDYLGEFTSELEADDYIEEFVLGGPKNYGYRTKKGNVECKVRGFWLISEGKTQLNYDVMRQNVLDEMQKP